MSAKLAFSEREVQLMSLAWQCFDEQPKVDFNKLAVLAGMSAGGASNAWRAIKKKLAEQAGNVAAGNGAGTPKRTPSKPKATPKKRGKKASDEDEEDDEEIGTPAPKKPRSARKASATLKKYTEESDEADEPVKAEANEDGEEDDDVLV